MKERIVVEEDQDSVDANGALVGVTDGGKDIRAVQGARGWSVCMQGGGKLPTCLKGSYTNYKQLHTKVQYYLSNQPKTRAKKPKSDK